MTNVNVVLRINGKVEQFTFNLDSFEMNFTEDEVEINDEESRFVCRPTELLQVYIW